MGEFAHKPLYLAAISFSLFAFVVVLVFNGLAGSGGGQFLGIFLNTTAEISNKYYTCITPVGWTFTIWGVIYFWQAVWLGYGLSTICRQGADGYLYYSPNLMPPALYIIFGLNNLLNTTWIFMWDRAYMIVGLVVLILIVATLYICMGLSFLAVYRSYHSAIKHDLIKEIWWVRFCVQNGLGIYAAWTTIATLINFTIVLIYEASVDDDVACTVSLSILAGILLLWFTLDTFFLDSYVRYTFTPYMVVPFALAGCLTGNNNEGSRNTIFNIVLLAVSGFLLLVKFVLMFVRHKQRPLMQITFEPTKSPDSGNVGMNAMY